MLFKDECRFTGVPLVPATKEKMPPKGVEWTRWRDQGCSDAEYDAAFNQAPNFAVMCGEWELIDVDIKNDPDRTIVQEFDAALRAELDPALYDSLVKETTPSGGFHYWYRVDPEKKRANVVLANKRYDDAMEFETGRLFGAIIETRGHGGIGLCYPSIGYNQVAHSVIQAPLISENDRDLIWMIAMGFNSYVKMAENQQSIVFQDGKRPGDRYSDEIGVYEIVEMLEFEGFKPIRSTGSHIFFNRPGAKNKGRVDATLNIQMRLFYCFSTSISQFDSGKGYKFFSLYAIFKYRGDYKAAARSLAASGYSDKADQQPRSQSEIAEQEKSEWDLIQAAAFDITKKPTTEYNLFVTKKKGLYNSNRWGIGFKGALICVQGVEKSRKTTFLGAMIADGRRRQHGINIAGTEDLPFEWQNIGKVLFVDTEQPDFYFYKTQQNICIQSGLGNTDDYLAVSMKKDMPTDRIRKVDLILEKYKPTTIIFDGIADFVFDTNDLKECNLFFEKHLNRWLAAGYTIFAVIHENKSDGKLRGNIGSMLQRKQDYGISCKAVDDKIIEVTPKFARGMKFDAFNMTAGKNGILYCNKMPAYDFGDGEAPADIAPVGIAAAPSQTESIEDVAYDDLPF